MLQERNLSTMPSLLVSVPARNSGILATMLRGEDSFKKYHRPTLSKMTTTSATFGLGPLHLRPSTFRVQPRHMLHLQQIQVSGSTCLFHGRKESRNPSIIIDQRSSTIHLIPSSMACALGTRGRRRRWWPSDDRPLLQS